MNFGLTHGSYRRVSVTTYYQIHPGYGPGTPANISPNHAGITSIQNFILAPPHPIPIAAAAAPPAPTHDPVDDAMDRAKVPNADPPRLARVDPSALKPLLERKTSASLKYEKVDPRANGSELQWTFGTSPHDVDVTMGVFDAPDAAVHSMRDALGCISAPLDKVLVSKLHLGQRTLQGAGGPGYILFVRDNIFVTLRGMASSDELGAVAVEIDGHFKARQGDTRQQVPGPVIGRKPFEEHQVQVGSKFEVAIEVQHAGWMTAVVNSVAIQLLEVDKAHAKFTFYAVSPGTTEVRFVFVQETTLQTAITSVKIVVVGHESAEHAEVVLGEAWQVMEREALEMTEKMQGEEVQGGGDKGV